MSAIQITREDLIKAATNILFHSSAIDQIMKDTAERFYVDNAYVSLATAAKMTDMSERTLIGLLGKAKVKRFGPRLSRVKVSELQQFLQSA